MRGEEGMNAHLIDDGYISQKTLKAKDVLRCKWILDAKVWIGLIWASL
jgi:hypothetical protein